MKNKSLTVDVVIDEKIFRRFAVFDNLLRQRRWLSLAAFPIIMLVFACVCFAVRESKEQAVLLGYVLMIIGIVIPAVYLFTFFSSIRTQVKKHRLAKPRSVYSLTLSEDPDGVHVRNTAGESAQHKWDDLYGVYRVASCTYLYVLNSRAFLLPDEQVGEGPDVLWSLFADMMPAKKLHDHRIIKK